MKNHFGITYQTYEPMLIKAGIRPSKLGEEWLTVGNIELASRRRWLIFVSCMACDMSAMLKEVVPVLLKHNAAFRIIKDQLLHYQLNAAMLQDENFGKALTIYPNDLAHAQTLVQALLPVSDQHRGPMIDDSIQLGKNLYVGYAQRVDETGSPENISTPRANKIPFALNPDYPLKPKLGKVIGDQLYPCGIVVSSFKATLYKAVDRKTSRYKLIKRGRRYVADDALGRHTQHRLTWEKEVLEDIADEIRVPENLDYFEVQDDPCISMSSI